MGSLSRGEEAQELIQAGRVLVAGAVADKPARLVALSDAVVVEGPGRRYVSRGGVKLEAALERFGIDVHASIALDAGASTGGFTDCLLQRGASFVYAVDVGHGQLDPRLRDDAGWRCSSGPTSATWTLPTCRARTGPSTRWTW